MDSSKSNAEANKLETSNSSKDVPPQRGYLKKLAHLNEPIALHAPELAHGISYRPIFSDQDPDFDFLYEVYTQSFQEAERRSKEQLIEEMSCFEACVGLISYQGERAGLFIYWELEDFIYAGHFAIHEDMRNDGIGSAFMSQFINWAAKPVILEVEPPHSKIQKRRINFYQKLGFKLFECDYVQPAYDTNKSPVPLFLMETDAHGQTNETYEKAQDQEIENSVLEHESLLETSYEEVKQAIHQTVYGVE